MNTKLQDISVQGFILSRHWFERQGKQILQFWIRHCNQCYLVEIEDQQPLFFILQRQAQLIHARLKRSGLDFRIQTLHLKAFDQEPLSGCYFSHWRDLKTAARICTKAGIKIWEEDITPTDRYLMERFITGSVIVQGQINHNDALNKQVVHKAQLKAPLNNEHYWPALSMVSLDIETSAYYPGEPVELYSIALKSVEQSWIGIIVSPENQPLMQDINAQVIVCENEKQLLTKFIEKIQTLDPDLIIGWNVVGFDLRVLQEKCDQYGIDLALGRGDNPNLTWRQMRDSQGQLSDHKWHMDIIGRRVLDGIDALKTGMYNFETFALEHVARELLGRGKLIHQPNQRVEEITRLFNQQPDQLAIYNLEDCQLVLDIFERCELLKLLMSRSELTGHSLDRFGGSAAAFNFLYLPRLHRKGYVAPSVGSQSLSFHSPGGYVMDSRPGLYDNVLVLDFKSLYPSIIRTFFIDPYGMTQALHDYAHLPLEGFDGARFDRKDHILPAIIDFLWQARDQAKASNNQPLSQAIKIQMNSFYGVLGSNLCRFYDPRLSSSITKRGHEILQLSKDWIENLGYPVLYGDTDSLFVWIQKAVEGQEAKAIGEKLTSGLNQQWQEHLQSTLGIQCRLEIEFETHYKKFFMPTIRGTDKGSKKRYAGLIRLTNGEDKIIFKGLETVRSDWTELAKDFQQQLYNLVFHDKPVADFIKGFVDDLYEGKKDHQIIYRRRLRKPLEEYQKNIPPHAQAAKLARSIDPRFPINSIEYVLTVSGVEPLAFMKSAPDYDQYLERQIQPIAESVLHFLGLSFDEIINRQISLI